MGLLKSEPGEGEGGIRAIEKPSSKLETAKTVVEILAGITAIIKAIYEMLKGIFILPDLPYTVNKNRHTSEEA